jgi:hypothetical protein
MLKNADQSKNRTVSRVEYGTCEAGGMYVVRRLELKVDDLGRHAGSIRNVGPYPSAAEAERHARALQRLEQVPADGGGEPPTFEPPG